MHVRRPPQTTPMSCCNATLTLPRHVGHGKISYIRAITDIDRICHGGGTTTDPAQRLWVVPLRQMRQSDALPTCVQAFVEKPRQWLERMWTVATLWSPCRWCITWLWNGCTKHSYSRILTVSAVLLTLKSDRSGRGLSITRPEVIAHPTSVDAGVGCLTQSCVTICCETSPMLWWTMHRGPLPRGPWNEW